MPRKVQITLGRALQTIRPPSHAELQAKHFFNQRDAQKLLVYHSKSQETLAELAGPSIEHVTSEKKGQFLLNTWIHDKGIVNFVDIAFRWRNKAAVTRTAKGMWKADTIVENVTNASIVVASKKRVRELEEEVEHHIKRRKIILGCVNKAKEQLVYQREGLVHILMCEMGNSNNLGRETVSLRKVTTCLENYAYIKEKRDMLEASNERLKDEKRNADSTIAQLTSEVGEKDEQITFIQEKRQKVAKEVNRVVESYKHLKSKLDKNRHALSEASEKNKKLFAQLNEARESHNSLSADLRVKTKEMEDARVEHEKPAYQYAEAKEALNKGYIIHTVQALTTPKRLTKAVEGKKKLLSRSPLLS